MNIDKINNKPKPNPASIRNWACVYAVYCVLIYGLCVYYNEFHALIEGSRAHYWYLHFIALSVTSLLELFGTSVTHFGIVLRTQYHVIAIANHCDGLLLIFFLGLSAAALPFATLKKRLKRIIIVVFAMFTLNIIRISSILWFGKFGIEVADYMHEEAWPIIQLAVVFGIFLIWSMSILRRSSHRT